MEVLNTNEAPIAVNFTTSQVPEVFENTTTESVVGTLVALDADRDQYLTFTLDDDSQGEFSLDPTSLICQSIVEERNQTKCTIQLMLSKPVNYELNRLRSITIRVTDARGLFRVQAFTLNVLDCNDKPTNITLGGSVSVDVPENSVGAIVGELETIDEDSHQNWTYRILNDFGGLFKVNGKYIYVNKNSHLNYEDNSRYIISVNSRDNGVPAYEIIRNFTIVVTNVNEAPTKIILSNDEIVENSSPGKVIANVTVEDPDNQLAAIQTHSCIVLAQKKFRIESQRLISVVALDYERTQFVNVSIECYDSGTPSLKRKQRFTIKVKDINEAPVDIVLSSLSVLENQDPKIVGKLSAKLFFILQSAWGYYLVAVNSVHLYAVIPFISLKFLDEFSDANQLRYVSVFGPKNK